MPLLEGEHVTRVADAGAGQRPDRPGRDRIDADGARTEVHRQIAHRRFQRRLGRTHGVVVRHRALAAVIGQGQHRAAVRHQRSRALRRLGEGEARDQHGAQKIVAGGVGVAAGELRLVGEGHGVDEEIERPPGPLELGENGIDRGDVLDVARQHQIGIDRRRQRFDALGERVALVGEGELGLVRRERPGDAPGDRVIVGDPHDQPALAVHQPLHASILFVVISCRTDGSGPKWPVDRRRRQ